MAKLIVGLGNIGKEFEKTNHNMGFMVVDKVAKELGISIKKSMCSSLVGEGNFNGDKIILAKPTTYMNNSGIAVKSLVKKYGIDTSKNLLIISDDIDLPLSHVRVREKGSAGTHNGLKSIIKELGLSEFPRLRMGVGACPEYMDLADYVLSRVKDGEELEIGLDKGLDACVMFCEGATLGQIMQKVN